MFCFGRLLRAIGVFGREGKSVRGCFS